MHRDSGVASLTPAAVDALFRLSADYRLIPFGRLDAEVESALSELRKHSESYGILKPVREGSGTLKVVGKEAALLLLTLKESGPLPAFVLEAEDAESKQAQIAVWVADSVLEVFDGEHYVSGPTALALISRPPTGSGETGTLADLSREAIRLCARLELADIEILAERLYAFHRLPLSARWRRRLSNTESVFELCGIGDDPDRWLAGWKHGERDREFPWLPWSRSLAGKRVTPSEPTWKLYLSPAMGSIRMALEVLRRHLPTSRAWAFKIGADAIGLLRPDKIVVYFDNFDDLADMADRLTRDLEGMPAHGVPFSAEIAAEGLLSWGMDPPTRERILPWQATESWRSWLVRRLAAALITAQARPSDEMPAWRFALERLRLEGVDVDRWVPNPALWRYEA